MVNPDNKLKKIILISGITGAVYGGFKYLLPLVVPFVFAYGAAVWLYPFVRYIRRRVKIPAAVIGTAELAVLIGILGGVLYFCAAHLISQLEAFLNGFPEQLYWLDVQLTGICRNIEGKLGLKNDELVYMVGNLIGQVGDVVKTSTMPLLMNHSMLIFKALTEKLIVFVIFFVSVLMFLQEMEAIREKKSHSMFHREFFMLGNRLTTACSAWLKTQGIVIVITSALCVAGLLLIGNSYAWLFGIGIGILDALPIFGTGTVLIPWTILCFLRGNWKNGLVLSGLYVLCYFLRQILEARIMGNQVGLSAPETLISMYVGLKLFGVSGFLLGPIGLLFIKDFVGLYWEEYWKRT